MTKILVTGGTGKTGRRVARLLAERGVDVRVGSRSAEVPFDWEDQATWAPALEGASAAYVAYVPDLGFPGASEAITEFCKIATTQGVRRLVLLSGRGEEEAQVCERIVRDSGLEWTVVRASWFAQNFSENFLLDSVLAGEIALPAGEAVEAFVDADDIAEVAVAALTEDRHVGEVYELSGPRLLSFHDVAAELSEVTGRQVSYVPLTAEQYAAVLREYGMPEDFLDLFTKILDGRNAHLTDGVQRALGRPPRDFAEYARQAAATGVWDVN